MKLNKTNTLVWGFIAFLMIAGSIAYIVAFTSFLTDQDQKESNGLVIGDSVRHGNDTYTVQKVDSNGHGLVFGDTWVTFKAKVK
jgi:hypothetical protein